MGVPKDMLVKLCGIINRKANFIQILFGDEKPQWATWHMAIFPGDNAANYQFFIHFLAFS